MQHIIIGPIQSFQEAGFRTKTRLDRQCLSHTMPVCIEHKGIPGIAHRPCKDCSVITAHECAWEAGKAQAAHLLRS